MTVDSSSLDKQGNHGNLQENRDNEGGTKRKTEKDHMMIPKLTQYNVLTVETCPDNHLMLTKSFEVEILSRGELTRLTDNKNRSIRNQEVQTGQRQTKIKLFHNETMYSQLK